MSIFPFNALGATPTQGKITGNSATTIIDGTNKQIPVARLQVNENSGTIQNLTVSMTDGTTTVYLGANDRTWKAQPVSAYLSLDFGPFIVSNGWTLKLTSSDASGKFDYIVVTGPVA